ncbi:MAG: hypothetical protein U0744_01410 [Gemmataceae bacterium]
MFRFDRLGKAGHASKVAKPRLESLEDRLLLSANSVLLSDPLPFVGPAAEQGSDTNNPLVNQDLGGGNHQRPEGGWGTNGTTVDGRVYPIIYDNENRPYIHDNNGQRVYIDLENVRGDEPVEVSGAFLTAPRDEGAVVPTDVAGSFLWGAFAGDGIESRDVVHRHQTGGIADLRFRFGVVGRGSHRFRFGERHQTPSLRQRRYGSI